VQAEAELRAQVASRLAQRQLGEAHALLAEFLSTEPEHLEFSILFAQICLELRDWPGALAASERTLLRHPEQVECLYVQGRALKAGGKAELAEASYRRALARAPDHPSLLTSLGILLRERGRYEEAMALYHRALAVQPDHVAALHNLANAMSLARLRDLRARAAALAAQGESEAARAALLEALELAPKAADLWLQLGILDCAHGRAQSGLERLEEAARLEVDTVEASEAARRVCASAGLYERGLRHGERVLRVAPSERVALAHGLLLPCIQASRESIRLSRERYARTLNEALASDLPLGLPDSVTGDASFGVPSQPSFFLAYHDENNRQLQSQLARVYLQRHPSLAMRAAHCDGRRRSAGRLRIGFISRYFRKHSIAMTSRGLIDQLARDAFEVYALRITPSGEDAVTATIRAAADRSIDLPSELTAAREAIAALELDILFYQDIGMEPMSYFLAFARLAPVQCVSFGHPDTTGIPNLDCFISNDLFEPDDAQEHYSESLVLLRDLPTLAYYYRPPRPTHPAPRSRLGLRDSETLYLCPQTLFKLHPDFDRLLAGILARDSKAVVLLIEGGFTEHRESLRQRFRSNIPADCDRIRFLPRMHYGAFLELLAAADVILDTVHFNGMNTSLEAFALGVPVVTLPGRFQRGRHTQAMYRKMAITDCVADDEENYIDIAVRIGTEPDYARDLRARIRERNEVLFEDPRVVREFERFFHEAAARAGCAPT
jgi:predicted O-linked N-acetylglucosamine transferase (SPINDLY family)